MSPQEHLINEAGLPDKRATDKGLGGVVREMQAQLKAGDSRMGNLEVSLATNTKATKEILEIVQMGKTFFRILGWFGRAVKWLSGLVIGISTLWYVFTHGTPHK